MHQKSGFRTLRVNIIIFVASALGMAQHRDPVFHMFVHMHACVIPSVCPSFVTTLALTLLFTSVTMKSF